MRLSHRPVDHRVLHGALSRLEPGAGKLARRVLRGPGDGDVTRLPDYAPSLRSPWRAAMEADEGRLLTVLHRHRERSRKLVEQKKAQVLRAQQRLACEVCGFDFAAVYGERGVGFIECHHTRPVSEGQAAKTRLKDLALVCANCHRMIHAQRPWLTLDELRGLLA